MWKVRLSSKGQVVIPVEIRERLGLKKGAFLTVRIEGKKIVIEPIEELSSDLFVKAEEHFVNGVLREAKESSDKARRLLRDLGVG